MPLDHDGKLRSRTYSGGPPPPDRPSDDLPPWAFILVVAVALTLLLALLHYAIDLLGVVFLIILVGFSIRTVGDWLTENESVSAWAVSAVSTGLIGTMLVGLWVFSSPEFSGTAITDRLPPPVVQGMQWLEARGWGQRVLLSSPAVLNTNADAMASRAPSGLTPPPASPGGGRSVSSPASEVGQRACDAEAADRSHASAFAARSVGSRSGVSRSRPRRRQRLLSTPPSRSRAGLCRPSSGNPCGSPRPSQPRARHRRPAW